MFSNRVELSGKRRRYVIHCCACRESFLCATLTIASSQEDKFMIMYNITFLLYNNVRVEPKGKSR